jgi:DNA-binding beta-propeller fold protein YncE
MMVRTVILVVLAGLLTLPGNSIHAQGVRTRVVIGESLTDNEAPEPGQLNSPFGIDFDAAGNMYIAELEGGRVHKLDPGGVLTRISGDGSKGYTGDGGPAAKATFDGMHNIAVTPSGDAYISDAWNHCVRKIDGKTGIISTIAGTGKAGFSGDGGPATRAMFDFVMCVSLNPANDKLYVADLKNRRIRVIDLASGIVTTVAGNGEKGKPVDGAVATKAPLVDPRAVAVDSQKNIYVLERSGHALRVVTPDGTIKTVVGTGTAGNAIGDALKTQLRSPKHIGIDDKANVLIADEANKRILRYDPAQGTVTAILGKGVKKPNRGLSKPHGVYFHSDGSIYVVDTGHHRILRISGR